MVSFEEDNDIILVNDNNKELFNFEWRVYGERVSSEIIVKDKNIYNRQRDDSFNIQKVPSTQSDYKKGAIGAQYTADTLSILIEDESKEIGNKGHIDTAQFSSTAAIISLGQFIKMAAASYLDVVPDEFSSGVQIKFSDKARCKTPTLFLSDSLENGSGLTRIISKPDTLRKIIEVHLGNVNWEEDLHQGKCDTSCANCLRTYQNLSDHHLLDWRLALDMADLLLGRTLKYNRWFDEAGVLAKNFVENFNRRYGNQTILQFDTFEGVPVVFDEVKKKCLIFSHPLWHANTSTLNDLQEDVRYEINSIRQDMNPVFVDIREYKSKPHEQEIYFLTT